MTEKYAEIFREIHWNFHQTLCKGLSVFKAVLTGIWWLRACVCMWWCCEGKWGWFCTAIGGLKGGRGGWPPFGINPCWVSSCFIILVALSFSFFFFILRFWNQTLTCLSLKPSLWLISHLLFRVIYAFIANSFSRCSVCTRVYGFRFLRVRAVSPFIGRLKSKNKKKPKIFTHHKVKRKIEKNTENAFLHYTKMCKLAKSQFHAFRVFSGQLLIKRGHFLANVYPIITQIHQTKAKLSLIYTKWRNILLCTQNTAHRKPRNFIAQFKA